MAEQLSLYVLGLFIYVLGVVLLGESLSSFPDSKLRDCLSSLLGASISPAPPTHQGSQQTAMERSNVEGWPCTENLLARPQEPSPGQIHMDQLQAWEIQSSTLRCLLISINFKNSLMPAP